MVLHLKSYIFNDVCVWTIMWFIYSLKNICLFPPSSFGYSDKVAVKGLKPIGMYGNGFKSGAMRLGRDAIVFSKSKSTSCVGMLSQTYLEEIGAEQIIVPIACFEQRETNNYILYVLH